MKKDITNKKYLFVKRAAIMVKLYQAGYGYSDIGIIFNIDRAWVKRVVDKNLKLK